MDGVVAPFDIGGRKIGKDAPCFVIAEAGVNHDGDPGKALALIDAAADAGADAVKFQTFIPEKLATAITPKAEYQKEAGREESQLDMLKRLSLDQDAHGRMAAHCEKRNIIFLSTPFDKDSADMLDGLAVPAFKMPSGELTNLDFLGYVAAKGKPLIVSTGMATLKEVGAAVDAIVGAGDVPFALLHCVSAYPAAAADCNLRAMETLERTFGVAVGWSDHTLGSDVALAAVALGAAIVEKHLTLDKTGPGPDHRASMEPADFKSLVGSIRAIESALGDGRKAPRGAEKKIAAVARKSLVAARDCQAGEKLAPDMVARKRPGTGLPPAKLPDILGRVLNQGVAEGTPFQAQMFAGIGKE